MAMLTRREEFQPLVKHSIAIGSVTKQFTTWMLLQLDEAGRVNLSDPVEKYFRGHNEVILEVPSGSERPQVNKGIIATPLMIKTTNTRLLALS